MPGRPPKRYPPRRPAQRDVRRAINYLAPSPYKQDKDNQHDQRHQAEATASVQMGATIVEAAAKPAKDKEQQDNQKKRIHRPNAT